MVYLAIGVGFLVVALLARFASTAWLRPPAWAVLVVAALAALGCAAGDAAPTGWNALDVALRAVLGAVLVAAGGRAGRLAPAVASLGLVAVLVVAASPVAALAGLAFGMAVAAALAGGRTPVVGALVGALVAQVVLRLEWSQFTGASLVAGSLVSLVLVLPALVDAPKPVRRPLAWAGGAVVVVVAVGVVGAVVAAVRIADDVDAAVASAERGLGLVGDDNEAARQALMASAARFATAEGTLDAPWALPARAVPLVAQQVRAVATMVSAGAELASVAAGSVAEADVERISLVDGRVDLDAVRALQEPLARADAALTEADDELESVRSPWLVEPVADRRAELAERVEQAGMSARLAATAVRALPAMLGGDGPRRYLLLVQQPSEARGSGGLPGNFAEIVADDGRLEMVWTGRSDDLEAGGIPPSERTVDMPARFDALYGFEDYLLGWKNVTSDPDFPVVAELVRQLYPQSGGTAIDGVMSVDPTGLAALLAVTGPVELEDGRTLTRENVEQLLYFEQYLSVGDRTSNQSRIEFLGDATELIWRRLTSGDLPDPRALSDALGPAADAGHLQFAAFDPEVMAFLERIGTTGAIPQPAGDGVGVVLQNLGENKIDWFVDRTSAYDVSWDPESGAVAGTYRVTVENRAPASGLPDYVIGWGGPETVEYKTAQGESLSLAYLYTAMEPVAVRGDVEVQGTTQRDGAWYVTPVRIRVAPGSSAMVELDVAGSLAPGAPWRLDVVRQPSINGDELAVTLEAPEGWSLERPAGFEPTPEGVSATLSLEQPVSLSVSATAAASSSR